MRVVFQCEIDAHCQQVLRRHWPKVPLHEDITTLQAADIPRSDLWCAGWPCQDVSHGNAQRKGLGGKRSGLFHNLAELLSVAHPKWVVLENVPGILSSDEGAALETVVGRLEDIGYLGGWFSANTCDAGLPQDRDRVFFVGSFGTRRAYHFFVDGGELSRDFTSREREWSHAGPEVRSCAERDAPVVVQRRGGFGYTSAKSICPTLRAQTGKHQGGHSDRPILCGEELDVGRMREANGISRRLDGRRGRLIGNAVSPVIAEWIGRRVLAIEELYHLHGSSDEVPAIAAAAATLRIGHEVSLNRNDPNNAGSFSHDVCAETRVLPGPFEV
jgi:DNA (cytosine-5)-methyltransferase 1